MRQPLWKRWLSYLVDIELERRESIHNELLSLSLSRGRYQLCTKEAVYSFEDRYTNYYRAFQRIHLDQLPGREVLILGVGLASIAHMLTHNFKSSFHFTGVEIDEEVIDLASTYALPKIDANIELIHADAETYINITDQKFDLICVDLFISDVIPIGFKTQSFFERLAEVKTDDGLIMMNHLSFLKKDREEAQHVFATFKKVFPEAHYLDVNGNWMFLNHTRLVK